MFYMTVRNHITPHIFHSDTFHMNVTEKGEQKKTLNQNFSACSRIEDPIKDLDEFVHKCKGEKVIKAAPGVKLELDLAMLSSDQICKLFENAEQLFICITAVRTFHKKLMIPKLKHIEACEGGEHASYL